MLARRIRFVLIAPFIAWSATAVPVTALTDGPGNDTEAAWSPDGRRIVFQSDRGGDLDLLVLDLDSGGVTALVACPGNACYPAWSPDGTAVAYSFGNLVKTAAQGPENGYNLFVVPAAGAPPRRLTAGLVRDYLPTFTPDGATILFSSTHGLEKPAVGVRRVPAVGGDPETVLAQDSRDTGFVQPDVSPDGHLLACGCIGGLRSVWGIRLARMDEPSASVPLTPGDMVAYGPRWSPDGLMLACTGFRVGDPDWGVFLIEARTGRVRRLETGAGNARGPDWSPDGRRLVFESNRTGTYKLYRLTVPTAEFPAPAASPGDTCEPVVDLAFDGADGAAVPDLTGKGNAAQVVGTVAWRDGHAVFGAGGHLTIPSPQGVDFGQSTFSVSATVRVAEHTGELRLIAVGDYPDSRRGWQFFLHPENVLWFNARAPDNRFVGARSDQPLPTGRDVRIAGVRRADGRVELYVDGFLQKRAGAGATRAYGAASQIRLGSQFDNTSPFAGEIAGFGVYSGTVSVAGDREKALSAFFDGGKRP